MSNEPPDLVGVAALARRLKIPAAWLKAETAAGRIPHLKAGRRLLFNLDAVKRCWCNGPPAATRKAVPRERADDP